MMSHLGFSSLGVQNDLNVLTELLLVMLYILN